MSFPSEKNELDLYLESIGGLVHSWDGSPVMSSYFFEVSSGWYKLIIQLIDDLIALGWTKHIGQVKSKFGGLRFYIDDCSSEEIADRIEKAETDSMEICELCGNAGKLVSHRGWVYCLCKAHAEQLGKE